MMLQRFALALGGIVAAVALFSGDELVGYVGRTTLVRAGDLAYQGSFKVPDGSGNGLAYGGTALAYNPVNNSLFIVGHDWDQLTAEISIPAYGSTATLIQPLTDSTSGKLNQIDSDGGGNKIGGNLVYKNRLFSSAFSSYDSDGSQTVSHFSRPTTLLSASATGPTRVGSMGAGFYSGYMGLIPAEWQAKLGGTALTGHCCMSIISRTSFGPAAFAFDPEHMGTASPLVYYDSSHQTLGQYGASGSHPVFNGSTVMGGIVFPQATSSVLFFGSTGTGNYCYGEGAACGDPTNMYKGEHAYPYRLYAWAYDANDLAAVNAGTKQPWSVVPYATWEIPEVVSVAFGGIGGAAYDPATARIFISQKSSDGPKPVIHVFTLRSPPPF